MIKKIITLKNIGLFLNALPSGACSLKRINVIYAENGRGKSTFAAICRALANGNDQAMRAKRSIGAQDEPKIHFRINNQNYLFECDQWTNSYPKVLVFDEDFVETNVCSGSRIEPSHRENLLEFALGETGVLLKNEIDTITEKIDKEINPKLRYLEKVIEQHSDLYSVRDYVFLEPRHDIEQRIDQALKRLNDAKNIDAIRQRPKLTQLLLPDFDFDGIKQLLAMSFDDVVEDAERMVKIHIEQCLGDGAEDWIQKGLSYLATDKCPFCGQRLQGVDLIAAYKSYFNNSYKNLKRRITDTIHDIREMFGEHRWIEIREKLRNNTNSPWIDRINLSFTFISEENLHSVWQALRDAAELALQAKAKELLSRMEVTDTLCRAYNMYKDALEIISKYNKYISEKNNEIDSFIASIEIVNLSNLNEEIKRLEAEKKRLLPDIAEYCRQCINLINEKNELETHKTMMRNELNQYTNDLLNKYKDTINQLLQKFGAGFSIESLSVTHNRGIPRSDYVLNMMEKSIPLAPQNGEIGPSFANALSSGDKRTLALAFFLARVKLEEDLKDHIIVVDDPVSSFDVGRQRFTCEALVDLSQHCSQLIVLSHNANFLRQFIDRIKDLQQCETLQIKRQGNYSVIETCDIYRMCQEEYYKVCERLMKYLREGPSGNEVEIANDIRVYLEYNLRNRFPIELEKSKNLGEMIRVIRENSHNFGQVGNRINDLKYLNDFSSLFHHGTSDRPTEITDTELKPMVELAMDIGRG